ncbi:hypothetical protein EJ065_3605 [Corallococcus coralloides]|uniref:Uncharacterized protein n=1 Tax=Corallococcus coralloides TaxID=184914 RepID=A0A410RTG7_CORCK|nr:hypothetical protein EJ065_3605 [Corallococcus coralloides]
MSQERLHGGREWAPAGAARAKPVRQSDRFPWRGWHDGSPSLACDATRPMRIIRGRPSAQGYGRGGPNLSDSRTEPSGGPNLSDSRTEPSGGPNLSDSRTGSRGVRCPAAACDEAGPTRSGSWRPSVQGARRCGQNLSDSRTRPGGGPNLSDCRTGSSGLGLSGCRTGFCRVPNLFDERAGSRGGLSQPDCRTGFRGDAGLSDCRTGFWGAPPPGRFGELLPFSSVWIGGLFEGLAQRLSLDGGAR